MKNFNKVYQYDIVYQALGEKNIIADGRNFDKKVFNILEVDKDFITVT